MNAIIWVRQGKERLALANISGSMMIQATIPSAIGIMATKWMFDTTLVVAAGVTFAAMTLLYFMFKRGKVDIRMLAGIGLLYAIFGGWMLFH
jgi:cation:H+ antiporter